MSNHLNGRQMKALEELAKALRPRENLAAALTECFGAAVEAGEKRSEKRLERRLEADKTERDVEREKDRATLRLFWHQLGGDENKRLPIDD